MTPEEITGVLVSRAITQRDIAVRAGLKPYNRSLVSAVINGASRSRKIEAQIAVSLGLPIETVFPDWYAEGGKRIGPVSHRAIPQSMQPVSENAHARTQDVLKAMFGGHLSHMPPDQLLGAVLCQLHQRAAYTPGSNPYPPRSPHHYGVRIGWELADARMTAIASQLAGNMEREGAA